MPNKPKFWISQLRGFGKRFENDYCHDLDSPGDYGDYSTIMSFNDMRDNKIKGYFCWGMIRAFHPRQQARPPLDGQPRLARRR